MGMLHPYPRRILLVEGDEHAYRLVYDLLSSPCFSGSTLDRVSDYDQVLDTLLKKEFDICLLDDRPGTRSAMELLEEVIRSGCPTPVIFLSGAKDDEIGLSAMKTGAADYLMKDQLNAALLERSMRYAMEIRRKNEELLQFKAMAGRQGAEQTRREYDDRYRLAMEATNDWIWELNIKTGEVQRNQALFFMLGYRAEAFRGRIEEWRGFVHPDDFETVWNALHDYIEGKIKKYDVEYRMLHKSGKVVWVHSRGKVVAFDENGNPSRMVGTISDITQRKRAEEMLNLSEEKFAAAFANNPAAIVMTHLEDGLFFDVNDTWLRLSGYKRDEVIGNYARNMGIWPTTEDFSRFIGELREKGFVRGLEQEFLKKSGERFVAQVSAQVMNVQGENIILATLVDITARRRAEEELQFHKTILEETGKIAKVGGWQFDALTGQGFWTDEVARIHDVDPALPTSMDVGIQYYADESREKIRAAVKEAIECGVPYDLELELVSAKGIRKWIRTIGHPVMKDGRVMEVKGSFQDISDRIQAQRALRESEERFRSLVKLAPVPMGLAGRDGAISFVNDRFTEVLGYTIEDIPTIEAWWRLAYPDSSYRERVLEGWQAALDQAAQRGGFTGPAEFNVICKDGRAKVLEISKIIVGDSLLASFIDLTERKRAEDALRDSLNEKTALLNEVHHRVKNNLQIVSSLLGLQAGRTDNREAVDILNDTRNRVKAMALLHETLYRSGSLARINFSTYVKDLCGQLLLSFGPVAKRVKLEYEMTQIGLPMKQAIPCGLIVSELVSNALEHGFTGKNSGRILLRLHIIEQQTLALGVRDEGVGLSKGFDPTGASTLGIQLVSRLAGQLGGRLEVEQPQDGGAYFRVVFPTPEGSILQDEP